MMLMRFILFVLMLTPGVSSAYIPQAYISIAKEYNIPPVVLYAVALVESEHPDYKRPWPWAANIDGESLYFQSREAMYKALTEAKDEGKGFAAGTMQIRWRWHKQRFRTLWDATNPYENIRAGAAYLSELFKKSRSWDVAVSHYHTQGDQEVADKYREKVQERLLLVLAGKR